MKLLRLAAAGLLLASAFPISAAAQALDPTFSPPTGLYTPGEVYSLGSQQADGKTVVAGYITRANGVAVTALVRLDAAGALDQPFSQNVGPASNVYHVKNLPNGQYLLGANQGNITAGGLTRTDLLRLNANGTADVAFDTGSGTGLVNGSPAGFLTEYAVQPDGKVVAVGSFEKFNGTNAPGVVRLNANGSVDTGFSVGTGFGAASTGYAVAIQANGKILVGGDFTSFNGQPTAGLVRLNADGSRDNTFLFAAPLNTYNSVEGLLLQPDGKILVNGSITNGSPGNFLGLMRLLPSGSVDTGFSAAAFIGNSLSPGGLSPVVQLQPDGKILIIGNFSAPGANKVARLNANGTQDLTFAVGTGPNGRPGALALQANGSVLFGGAVITSFNGRDTPLGRLTSTGAPDGTYAPTLQVPGSVAALAYQPDGRVVIGGNFSEVNGQAVPRLARLTAAGALDASFAPAGGIFTSPVSSLALQPDGKVLAGTAQGTFRFEANGTQDQTFGFSLNTTALALQPDGKVLIGGNFITPTHRYLIRATSTGATDPSFVRPITNTGPGLPKEVDAIMVQPDGRIVVAEFFGTLIMELPTVGRVVRYETSGALDASFNNLSVFTPFTNQNALFVGPKRVLSLGLQPDGKILAGGNFTGVSGTYHPRVARLLANGTVDATFGANATLTGNVYSVVPQPNGRVLLGGDFTIAGTSGTLSNLARVLDNGQTDGSFTNAASPGGTVRALTVRALAVQPNGAILLGGSFTAVGGQLAMGVARIAAPNVLAVAAPAAVAARTAAWPVPAHEVLHVAPDASAHPRSIELLDALGRPVRHLPATGAPEVTLDTKGLPAGVYLLRVHYAAGTVTRRLAVQ